MAFGMKRSTFDLVTPHVGGRGLVMPFVLAGQLREHARPAAGHMGYFVTVLLMSSQ